MKICILLGLLSALSLVELSCAAPSRPAGPSGPVLPDGLGVNIHFTDPKPGEMKMLAQGGFTWVRMDFGWNGTEKKKGEYDFAAYDRLMAALEEHKIRALFILDYSNKLYDNGLSPCSDEGRKAFAQWAAAAVKRFKGRGILWEMYNEPNIGFWKPKPNVDDFVKLALEVGKAIREAEPNETYIGPATSGVDFAFLEACFKAGLLEYWSAVSVHPYRQSGPETAAADYARLRRLIDQYAPKGKRIPILSGEWGYSSVWGSFNEEKQGKMLPRQWLTNFANDVPLSIWYDWHDDGKDPKEAEHHFVTVLNDYHAGKDPVYDPKPAYLAGRTLATVLAGFQFNKRLALSDPDDHVLLFSKGDQVRLAAWTTSATTRPAVIPAGPGKFAVTGHTGETLPPLTADKNGLPVELTDAPKYLVPEAPNDLLRIAAAWQRAPLEVHLPGQKNAKVELSLQNPLPYAFGVKTRSGQTVTARPGATLTFAELFDVPRSAEPQTVRLELEVEGMGRIAQEMRVSATNPFRLTILPPAGKAISVRVENPSGETFKGMVCLTDLEGLESTTTKAPLDIKAGELEKTVAFSFDRVPATGFRLGAAVEDDRGQLQCIVPSAAFALVDDFSRYTAQTLAEAYKTVADGDDKVPGTTSVAVGAPPGGPPAPGVGALKIAYDLDQGWKFARLFAQKDETRKIEGKPKAFCLWIYGDGSGNSLRLRFVDSTGQTFQPVGEPLKWKGWRCVVIRMDAPNAGHWGGADDGVIHYPIKWDTLLLIDKDRNQKSQGEIYIACPTLVR